jgi:CDP-diacylglycerol--serine O-phosphatidyltransferase
VYHYGLHELQFLGVIISALSPICGAVRLARFNVEARDVKGDFFRGLPIPAHAIMICAFYLAFYNSPEVFSGLKYGVNSVLIPVQIIVTFLMVTTIPFDKIPRFDKTSIKEHKGRYILFLSYLVAILLFQEYGLMAVFTVVIIRGLILGGMKFWKQAFGEDDDELDQEDEETVVIENYKTE